MHKFATHTHTSMDLIDFYGYFKDISYDTRKEQRDKEIDEFDDGPLIILITTLHGNV